MNKRRQKSFDLRRIFGRQLQTKLLMLVMAFLIWLFVRTDQETTVVLTLPVQVQMDFLPDHVILEEPLSQVSVTFEGRGRSLLNFALFSGGEYRLVPESPEERSHTVSTSNLVLEGDPDITVLNISPALLRLRLDERIEREVPIELRARVLPAEDFLLTGPVDWQPRRVRVSGARSFVDTLSAVSTEAVTMNKIKRDPDRRLRLESPFEGAVLSRPEVLVTAPVEKRVRKTIENVQLVVSNLPDSLEVFPMSLNLVLEAGEQQLEGIRAEDIRAELDYLRAPPGSLQVPCQLQIPLNLQPLVIEPRLFELRPALPELADSTAIDTLSFGNRIFLPGL